MMTEFYSNGKLLLTGEYTVLDGALSLAVPTSFGQSLTVSSVDEQKLFWKSFDEKGNTWFEAIFNLNIDLQTSEIQNFSFPSHENIPVAKTLCQILREARKLNPMFLLDGKGFSIETSLTFPRDWGLGSSSTLVNNIAQWAEVDAFQLLWNSLSGSGYDIACAQNDFPILYQLKGGNPIVEKMDFNPSFKDKLYFVHLNKKQDSRAGIAQYRKITFEKAPLLTRVSEITNEIVNCQSLETFEGLLEEHETLLATILKIPKVKYRLFSDYWGTIKSLGAWGGDFVLVTGNEETPEYFNKKGFQTVIPFSKMVL